jgi:hypothetical protein
VTGCRLKITLPTPRQNCRACGRTIEPEQDARRTGEADWVHDLAHPAVALLEAVGDDQGDGVRSSRTASAAAPRLPLFPQLPGTAGHAGRLRAQGKERVKDLGCV